MKPLAVTFLAALLCTLVSTAAEEARVVAQPDLKSPLPADWQVRKGTWEVADGVLSIAEVPEDKHAAVLWHQVPLQRGAVECEFLFDGARTFILGCDGDRHIGRVVITPQWMRLVDDSTEVKGKSPGTKLAEGKLNLKPGEWHSLRYEWSGDRMAATLDGQRIEGSASTLAKPKARWWFAVSGKIMKVRHVKVTAPDGASAP